MSGWQLQEKEVHCPYCGEAITVLLNPEDVGQDYIEDCQVCCRPIEFCLSEGGSGELYAEVRSELEC